MLESQKAQLIVNALEGPVYFFAALDVFDRMLSRAWTFGGIACISESIVVRMP